MTYPDGSWFCSLNPWFVFSQGYRRYLVLCLRSSVSQYVGEFLFFKTHIKQFREMESCMDYVCNAKKLKDLKNKDNLKNEDNLKIEDDL